MKIRTLTARATALAVVLLPTAPAVAAAGDDDASRFLRTVQAVAPEVLAHTPARFDDRPGSAVRHTTPGQPGLTVVLDSVDVELPGGRGRTATLPNGNPVHRTDDGVSMAPIVKDDGSVQVTFVVDGAASPTSYDFAVERVPGARLALGDDGSVTYTAKDGRLLLAAPAPWAKDADGRDVPTRFEVRGNSLVQVVEHTGAGVSYPVVADPWLGQNLFSSVWTDTYNGDSRINATKSLWGQSWHTPSVTGQAIFLNQGWSEVSARAPRVTSKTSLHQQYQCHVAGGYANLAGTWNLERFRPTRTTHWSYGVAVHHCNWTTATRY